MYLLRSDFQILRSTQLFIDDFKKKFTITIFGPFADLISLIHLYTFSFKISPDLLLLSYLIIEINPISV